MKLAPDQLPTSTSGLLDDAVAVLLDFGAAAMRAGNTARRTREWMEMLANNMGLDAVSVSLSFDDITVGARCSGQRAMAMRDLEPAGINGWRIGELEELAKTAEPRLSPSDVAAKLADIDSTPPFYSRGHIAGAIAVASAGFARLAYGVMMLLVVAFGLSIVIAAAGVDLSPQQSLELAYQLKMLLRGLASFAAGCAFAMLFNNSTRIVFAAGILALAANELRLVLHDNGMMLAPAAFLGALVIGVVTCVLDLRFNIPRITMIVPRIIIMVPGLYPFEMIALLNRGEVLAALQAGAACGFVIGALAMGLATAGFLIRR
jgi:uncharacterized membrane protein YjjP (DUF1212 family)